MPARVFLDEPLPGHYPVVAVCERCNQGASKDEEYVACVIDAVLHGTVINTALLRPKGRCCLDATILQAQKAHQRPDPPNYELPIHGLRPRRSISYFDLK